MIEIKVENGIVSVQETEALYSGSANVISCRFAFDAGWEPFSKSAVFRVGGRAVTAVIDEDNTCTLPWELLTRANIGLAVEVGVYGVSAETEVLTTVWDSIGTVRDGSELGSDAREPGAGVYDQVMASIQRTNAKIEDYSGEMTTFLQRAESAARVAADSSTVAAKSEGVAVSSAQSAQSALAGVRSALDSLPAGDTLIINDLTTGGAAAALSAEMGKVLGRRPNPNLLRNWYFANAVNQRGQTEYAVKNAYAIDCWKNASNAAITLMDGYVSFATGAILQHPLDAEVISAITGTPVTFSALTDSGLVWGTATYTGNSAGKFYEDSVVLLQVSAAGHPYIRAYGEVHVIAVKLELGDTQTLAHQDEGGNWVLNEIPDYGEELQKCQRYYQLFSSEDARPTALADYRPAVRTTPKIGTITIDGVIHYYADASL